MHYLLVKKFSMLRRMPPSWPRVPALRGLRDLWMSLATRRSRRPRNAPLLKNQSCFRYWIVVTRTLLLTFGYLPSKFRFSQTLEIFGNASTPVCNLAINWLRCKISRRSSQGNPSSGVKRKSVAKYSDVGHVKSYTQKRCKTGVQIMWIAYNPIAY